VPTEPAPHAGPKDFTAEDAETQRNAEKNRREEISKDKSQQKKILKKEILKKRS
jgi:hypothetical protein